MIFPFSFALTSVFEQHTALLLLQNAGENRADSQPVRKSTVLFSPAERGADITRRFVDINAQSSLAGYLPTGQGVPVFTHVMLGRNLCMAADLETMETHTHTHAHLNMLIYTQISPFSLFYTPSSLL